MVMGDGYVDVCGPFAVVSGLLVVVVIGCFVAGGSFVVDGSFVLASCFFVVVNS